MKQITLILGLIFILGMGQSFAPNQRNEPALSIIKNNAGFVLDDQEGTRRAAPAGDDYYKLNMFMADESTYSEEFYGSSEESQMISDRVMYCENWNHWKQWRKPNGTYLVYATGMCETPPPRFFPTESDYAPLNAVGLMISKLK